MSLPNEVSATLTPPGAGRRACGFMAAGKGGILAAHWAGRALGTQETEEEQTGARAQTCHHRGFTS